MIYFICFIWSLIMVFLLKPYVYKWAMILIALPWFLISALRYELGTDYDNYVNDFVLIARGNENTYYEKGYLYLNKFVGMFTTWPQAIIVVTSFLFIALVFIVMYRHSKNLYMSITLFFLSYVFFISMNNLRQSLASAIVLCAMYALIDGKKILFLVLTIIAGLFHQSMFVFLAFFVLYYFNISAVILTCGAAIFYLIVEVLIPFLLSNLETIQALVPNMDRLSYYLLNNLYSGQTISRTLKLLDFLILVIVMLIEVAHKDKVKDDSEWRMIKYNQTALMLIYSLDGYVPAVYRIARIFSFLQFMFITNALERIEKPKLKILGYMFVLFIFGSMFFLNFITGAEEIFPYTPIINLFD